MAYAFNAATNLLLENSVFFNYTIKNKSGNNSHDLYFGLWNDFDLGCYADDYVGTDVGKNTIFVINQDSIDGDISCGNPSYGVDPPALAATWLSHPITKSIGYHNDFSVLGNPETSDDYYDLLRAIWKDGSPLAVDSLNPDGYQGADTVDFYFPDTSDSSVSGQPSNWWRNANLDPPDIRMIGSIGPFNLPSQGVIISLDFVYNFLPYNGSDEDGEGRLALSNSVQSIIDLFTNGTITSANQPEFEAVEITISPNPFHDFTTVRCNGKFEILKLMDMYKIDPRNVFVVGESAGGFIAMATAFLDENSEKPTQCNALAAVMPPDALYENQCIRTPGFDTSIASMNLQRPDLGSISENGNPSIVPYTIKGVGNFYGALMNDLFTNHSYNQAPALYLFHQPNDLVVPYTYDRL